VFDWLYEGRISVYVLLAVAAVVLLYAGRKTQKRGLLLAGGLVALLLGVYFLLDRFVETDREQIKRKLERDLPDAVTKRDTDRVLGTFSEKFTVWGMTKPEFRTYVDRGLKESWFTELLIWNIQFPNGMTPGPDGTVHVDFDAKPKGGRVGDPPHFHVESTFVRDPDGQWRMSTFKVFNPMVNSNIPLDRPPYL
jgi:hypothetical protein